MSLFVVLLIGFAVWQSFPTDAPKPPAGAIWFGTGYDSGLPGLTGRANTFSQGTTVWMTADLDESNQPLTNVDVVILMVDRVPSTSDIPRGHQLFSVVVPGRLDVGPHTVSIEDVGGRVRATGTFTVTAAPVDSNGGG